MFNWIAVVGLALVLCGLIGSELERRGFVIPGLSKQMGQAIRPFFVGGTGIPADAEFFWDEQCSLRIDVKRDPLNPGLVSIPIANKTENTVFYACWGTMPGTEHKAR
jgi:hypothetical protein